MATTTNLAIEIPDVGGDNATWGNIANDAFQAFDNIFKSDGTGTSVGLNVGSGKTQTVAGTLTATAGVVILPQGASAAPTAEGSIAWDTDDDALKIGDGSATKTIAQAFSGTYTPTLTNESNVASSTVGQFQYLRVGNVVTASGVINAVPTLSGVMQFRITLPVSSNLGALTNLAGSAQAFSGTSAIGGRCYADATNDAAAIQVESTAGAGVNVVIQFTYLVI